jgi:hypothetical protein
VGNGGVEVIVVAGVLQWYVVVYWRWSPVEAAPPTQTISYVMARTPLASSRQGSNNGNGQEAQKKEKKEKRKKKRTGGDRKRDRKQ